MKAHIDAIRTLLTPLGYPVHYGSAPDGAQPPYLLVWSPPTGVAGEQAVAPDSSIDTTFGVTSVAGTPEGVLIMAPRVAATLAPLGIGGLTVTGRVAWVLLTESRPVAVDREVTITATNAHPAYGVDLYRLVSAPA